MATKKKTASSKKTGKKSTANTPTAKAQRATKASAPGAKKTEKAKRQQKPKRVSALDAAVQVLAKTGTPMRATDLIAAMAEQGLWKSPGGKTPHATLYAAMLREIAAKGKDARFTKVDRGQFAFNSQAGGV